MESTVIFLIAFPFLSAMILALFKSNRVRKAVTYASSAIIIAAAIIFAVEYFTYNNSILASHEINGFTNLPSIFGMNFDAFMTSFIGAGEIFLVVLITVLSIKYKKYYCAVLSVLQTGLIFWYEFASGKEAVSNLPGFYIDRLTVIMVLIIAIVGTLITVYACGYMSDYHNHHTDVKDRRSFFFAIMYVFIGAMFGLVLSNALSWMYFFWEITSVCSFLLIGYTKTAEAITNCFRALWMNLLGGCGISIGIVWAGIKFGVSDLQTFLLCNGKVVIMPVICFAFAALTKSAQLPFSRWLLGAMVAPTPSSALLHSATMVKAGVYLLIRIAPLMSDQLSGYMIALIGGLTFLAMSMLAITVSDGKKVLAYSTLSNLGLITACAGIGTAETIWAAVFLVIFHAVSKSLLFQTVGSIEHQTGSRDIETMHGLVRRYPALTWMLVIGISGMFLAPFGMLVSKWAALKAFVDTGLQSGHVLFSLVSVLLVLCICFGSATTLLYWSKWLATILASNPKDKRHKNTISLNQWISLSVHSVLMIAICFVFPIISDKVVVPYIQNLGKYSGTIAALSEENIYFTIIMIVFVFVVPAIIFHSIAKERPYPKAHRYFNGAGLPDQVGFVDSFGVEKKEFLTNWYMTDIFGEKHMYKPSVYTSIALLVILTAASFIVGGGF